MFKNTVFVHLCSWLKYAVNVQLPFILQRIKGSEPLNARCPVTPMAVQLKYLQHLRFLDRTNNVFHLLSQNLCAVVQFQSCSCKTKPRLLHRSQQHFRWASEPGTCWARRFQERETAPEDATVTLIGLDKAASWKWCCRPQQERKSRQSGWPYANKVQSSSKVVPISVSSSTSKNITPPRWAAPLHLQLWPPQPPHQPHLLQWVDKILYSNTAQNSSPPSLQLLEFAWRKCHNIQLCTGGGICMSMRIPSVIHLSTALQRRIKFFYKQGSTWEDK